MPEVLSRARFQKLAPLCRCPAKGQEGARPGSPATGQLDAKGRPRGLFHAEFIANAEAKEEEENGAEDGLKGGKYFEPSERSIKCQTEIPAEAEDVKGVRGAEAQGFPIGARIEMPEGPRADSRGTGERSWTAENRNALLEFLLWRNTGPAQHQHDPG